MASQAHEFKAKSVDEAIEEGLAALKVQRDAVEIEVVTRGSRGIFGIGSEPAVVRMTLRAASVTTPPPTPPAPAKVAPPAEKPVVPAIEATVEADSTHAPSVTAPAPTPISPPIVPIATVDDNAEELRDDAEERRDDADMETMAVDMLDRMIYLMGFDATINATWREEEDDFEEDEPAEEADQAVRSRSYLHLDVEGADLGALIGRRGETLENIQYLLRLMVNQKLHRWKNIIIDIEHYKARRVTQLTQLAQRMAEQVAHSGRAVSLEPMPANERRIIHMALRDHPEVYTESYGDGNRRKVHIFAKD